MSTLTINNENVKIPAWLCKQDAARLDAININSYDLNTLAFGDVLFNKVTNAFTRSNVYRNYRQKFIAVKVAAPTPSDLASSAVVNLEKFCEENKIAIVRTASSLVFRINKA